MRWGLAHRAGAASCMTQAACSTAGGGACARRRRQWRRRAAAAARPLLRAGMRNAWHVGGALDLWKGSAGAAGRGGCTSPKVARTHLRPSRLQLAVQHWDSGTCKESGRVEAGTRPSARFHPSLLGRACWAARAPAAAPLALPRIPPGLPIVIRQSGRSADVSSRASSSLIPSSRAVPGPRRARLDRMAAEQLYGNILLGSRGGAVSSCRRRRRQWAAAASQLRATSVLKRTAKVQAQSPGEPPPSLSPLQSQGSLKISKEGLVWKKSGGGRTVEVPSDGAPACSPPPPAARCLCSLAGL